MDTRAFLEQIEPKLGPAVRQTDWKPNLKEWMKEQAKTLWCKRDFTDAILWLGMRGLPNEFPKQKTGQKKSGGVDRARAIGLELDHPRNPWHGVWYGGACKLDGDFIEAVPEGAGRIYDPIGENVHIEFLNRVAPRVNEAGFPKTVADFADRYGMLFSGDFEHVSEWVMAVRYLSSYDLVFRQLEEATFGERKKILESKPIRTFFETFDKALDSIRILNVFRPEYGKLFWAWYADSLWAYMCLGLFFNHFQKQVWAWRNLKLCANPKCPSPYFLEKRRNAKHCSTKCAREAANLRYEQSEKRKEKKRKYNREYYKRTHAKEKTL